MTENLDWMTLPEGFSIENVRSEKSPALKEEITAFWLHEGALGDRDATMQRVEQVIFIVRNEAGEIAGVCTVYEYYYKRLENYFYYYRTFIGAAYRKIQLAKILLRTTRDYLNRQFVSGENTRVIGMLLVVENEMLKKYRNEAVWKKTGFVYIGKNSRGDHMRIFYFEGARIT